MAFPYDDLPLEKVRVACVDRDGNRLALPLNQACELGAAGRLVVDPYPRKRRWSFLRRR